MKTMGWWSGTKLGFKVSASDEELAQQLLSILGVNMIECDMTEEIGELSDLSDFTADGLVEGDLLGAMSHLEKQFSDYQKQFSYYDDEDDEDDEEYENDEDESGSDVHLDDIFQIAKKVFSRPSMYLAHEDGNNTSDTYYRYEVIYSSGKKTELNCYYSYGEGVNVDSDDPKEEGTEKSEEKFVAQKPAKAIIDLLVEKAEAEGFVELVEKLKGTSTKTTSTSNKTKKEAIKKIPGLKIVKGIVVKYSGSNSELEIPEGVTEIGEEAFQYNYSLRIIKLPDSLEKIGESAFNQCMYLESIEIPKSVTSIGPWAFASCERIKEVIIPESVDHIEWGLFNNCYNLEHVVIPSKVTKIERSTFKNCKNLKSIDIPEGVTEIGDEAFFGCASLSSITLPPMLTTIGGMAFERCSGLSKLIIPESVKSIGWRLASNPTEVHIPNIEFWCNLDITDRGGPLMFGAKLFVNNELVEDLVIPPNVSKINDTVFACYEHLKSVTIPETVTDIGSNAFASCSNLKKATVPKALEEIITKRSVFYNCKELSEIVYV